MNKDLTYFSAKKIVSKNTELEKYPEVNILILRNITVDQIEVFLQYFSAEMNIRAKCSFGGFDTILQDAISPNNNLISESTDIVTIFYNLNFAYPNLATDFYNLRKEDLSAITEDIMTYVESCLAAIRSKTRAVILWPSFEPFLYSAFGIKDNFYNNSLNSFITALNQKVSKLFEKHEGCFFIDSLNIVAKIGEQNFYDPVRAMSFAAPYSMTGLKAFSLEISKFIRASHGRTKKCIICDCDNTLWGGVVGESSLDELKIGKSSFPGKAFVEFQIFVKQLSEKGILVALCSKNNEEDVWNVFENHREMILSKEDISIVKINWNNKAENIKEIANDLNLGLDSFVFVDDSDFECNLVRDILPEVTVVQVSKNPLSAIKDIIHQGYFDHFAITREDRERGKMYAGELQRKNVKNTIVDLDEYLKCLEISVEIKINSNADVQRISQLTQKTNQFNFTTKRYQTTDIEGMMESTDYDVLSLQVRDKLGDLGIVGVLIVQKKSEDLAIVDTFLLSCRSLGRTIEDTFLNECCMFLKKSGFKQLKGIYSETPKNSQIKDYYIKQGFSTVSSGGNEFQINLEDVKKKTSVFKSVECLNGESQ